MYGVINIAGFSDDSVLFASLGLGILFKHLVTTVDGQWPEAASDLGYNYLVTCTFQNSIFVFTDEGLLVRNIMNLLRKNTQLWMQ